MEQGLLLVFGSPPRLLLMENSQSHEEVGGDVQHLQ